MNRHVQLLILLLFTVTLSGQQIVDDHGAIIQSDTLKKNIYLCFTGHDFYDGFKHVLDVLKDHNVKGSFFLTGDFIRKKSKLVKEISLAGHFVGAHSDKHLLYCDWTKRDSLLFPEQQIKADILNNLNELSRMGIHPKYFMPPYEWYNKQVVQIARHLGQKTVNFSPGTRSNADYTTPEMENYLSSAEILDNIYRYAQRNTMNGFHLLIHPGTSPLRKDKLYFHLEELIIFLKNKGYRFERF